MTKESLIKLIGEKHGAEQYASYIIALEKETDKMGKAKNPWIKFKTEAELVDLFKRVLAQGLAFDGKHVTLQARGISYDYVAYKNKMLLAYPESKIDVQLVYKDDEFSYSKINGDIMYQHVPKDPFNQTELNIVGGYCIIENKRGNFMTTLTKADIEKARKVAKTDYIWRAWFAEMALKTVIKKAVKFHFDDLYVDIIDEDNKENNIDLPVDVDLKHKQAIEQINTLEDLKQYWKNNSGKGKGLDKLLAERKNFIINKINEQNT